MKSWTRNSDHHMPTQRAFLLAIIAGVIGGVLMVAINFTIVQARQSEISDFYADLFVAHGIIDEDEFNQKLQELQVQDIVLPIATGIGGGVLVAAVYLRIGAGAFKVALAVAGAAWLALYIMPAIKYPANPDTAYNPEGDGGYSIFYAGYTAASGFAALGSAIAFSKTGRKNWYMGAAGVYIGIIGVLYYLFPAFSSDLEIVPQQLLAEWHSSMAASAAALWFALGIIAGALLEREEKTKENIKDN
ncbi:MAG TPA: CbtA family protein [Nitrososphaera sp.]|nr:CbtA family protein [Nitrososphaera sp.]